MSTILGPLPCQACRQSVWWQRRTVEVLCTECEWLAVGSACTAPAMQSHDIHTHAIPDVAWTVVELDGTTHICKAAA